MTEAAVSFAGNLTDDPEVRSTDSGIARAMFRVTVGPAGAEGDHDQGDAQPGPVASSSRRGGTPSSRVAFRPVVSVLEEPDRPSSLR